MTGRNVLGDFLNAVDRSHESTSNGGFFSLVREGNCTDILKSITDNPSLLNSREPGSEETPVYAASAKGREDIVRILAQRGADLNITDKQGRSPAWIACWNGAIDKGGIEVLMVLIEYKADLNIADKDGWTPVCIASFNGHKDVIAMLAENGADLNKTDTSHRTALWMAAWKGFTEVVDSLAMLGADLNTLDGGGRSALWIATEKGHREVVTLLAERGADLNCGSDPMTVAPNVGLREVIRDAKRGIQIIDTIATHETLELAGCYLGDSRAAKIAVTLRNNKKITAINLSGNAITDRGVNLFVKNLAANRTLTSLNLLGNKISDSAARRLLELLSTNKTLVKLRVGVHGLDFDLAGTTSAIWFVSATYFSACDVKMLADLISYRPILLQAREERGEYAVLSGGGEASPINEVVLRAFVSLARQISDNALCNNDPDNNNNNSNSYKDITKWVFNPVVTQVTRNIPSISNTTTKETLSIFDIHHHAFWFALVASDDFASLAREQVKLNPDLMNVRDHRGRELLGMASMECRREIMSLLLLYGRYKILSVPPLPEHKSATCAVYLAVDEMPTPNMKVALKFMKNKDQFLREISARSSSILSEEYVINIIRTHSENELKYQSHTDSSNSSNSFSDYPHCIVMPAAERNLHTILTHEHIAAKDWDQIKFIFSQIVKATQHLHSKCIIHGDIKPLNIMRVEGKMRLIDLDASATCSAATSTAAADRDRNNHTNIGQYAGVKYSSAFLPPEMIFINKVEKEEKVVVKTFTLDEVTGEPVLEGLPYLPVRAAVNHDSWALGVTLF